MSTRTEKVITADGVIAVIDGAIVEATRLGACVLVTVVDVGDHPVAMTRMDGAPLLSIDVAADKARTAIAFRKPTHWWVDLNAAQPDLATLGKGNRLMRVPGRVRLLFGGLVVGGVGVSVEGALKG